MQYKIIMEDKMYDRVSRVTLNLAFFAQDTNVQNASHTWYTGENDLLKYRTGRCNGYMPNDFNPTDIRLCVKDRKSGKYYFGVQIWELFDGLGLVNDSGLAYVEGWFHADGVNREITWTREQ